jgi:hypothetical protein
LFAHSPKIVTDGLVLALDAGNTKSYVSGSTTWFDKSGFSNNGTLVNGPTFNTESLGSIVFDGANDYVNCSSLNINYSASFTVNTWFKLATINRSNTIIGSGDGEVGPYYYWMINVQSDNFLQFRGFNGSNKNISYNTPLTSNLWYCTTLTYNSGNCILYLNGTNVASGTVLTLNNPNASYTRLGYNTWAGAGPGVSNYLSGNIPTTQIYNRVLTQAEITQNFNALRGRFGI